MGLPLDQPFTYSLPETWRHRVRQAAGAMGDALRLIDAEPVLSGELLAKPAANAGFRSKTKDLGVKFRRLPPVFGRLAPVTGTATS